MRRLIVVLSLLVPACAASSSGPGDGPGDRTFAAECEVQCRTESEDSGCDAPSCVEDCIALSAGLEIQCGKCVVAQTEIYSGDSCELSLGTVSDCAESCTPGSHQVRSDFRAECESHCGNETDLSGCSMPTCVDECAAMTIGLETQCGKCVAAQTEIYNGDSCELSVGTIDESACDAACSPGSHQARPDFRRECEARCQAEVRDTGCPLPATCVSDCVAMTNGLETECGKCVAAQTEIYNGDGCELSVGTIDDSACDAHCTR